MSDQTWSVRVDESAPAGDFLPCLARILRRARDRARDPIASGALLWMVGKGQAGKVRGLVSST
jgi:hypothetical protein